MLLLVVGSVGGFLEIIYLVVLRCVRGYMCFYYVEVDAYVALVADARIMIK